MKSTHHFRKIFHWNKINLRQEKMRVYKLGDEWVERESYNFAEVCYGPPARFSDMEASPSAAFISFSLFPHNIRGGSNGGVSE